MVLEAGFDAVTSKAGVVLLVASSTAEIFLKNVYYCQRDV